MGPLSDILGIIILIAVIALGIATLIMPWVVLGINDKVRNLYREVEELNRIANAQLQELRELNDKK